MLDSTAPQPVATQMFAGSTLMPCTPLRISQGCKKRMINMLDSTAQQPVATQTFAGTSMPCMSIRMIQGCKQIVMSIPDGTAPQLLAAKMLARSTLMECIPKLYQVNHREVSGSVQGMPRSSREDVWRSAVYSNIMVSARTAAFLDIHRLTLQPELIML